MHEVWHRGTSLGRLHLCAASNSASLFSGSVRCLSSIELVSGFSGQPWRHVGPRRKKEELATDIVRYCQRPANFCIVSKGTSSRMFAKRGIKRMGSGQSVATNLPPGTPTCSDCNVSLQCGTSLLVTNSLSLTALYQADLQR
jgi:hypothetical protein